MHHRNGRDYDAIARMLRLSTSTVRTRVSQAKKMENPRILGAGRDIGFIEAAWRKIPDYDFETIIDLLCRRLYRARRIDPYEDSAHGPRS